MNAWLKLKKINRMRNIYLKGVKLKLKLNLFHLFYRKRSILLPNDYKTVCIFMHTQAIGDAIVTSGFIGKLKDKGLKVYVIAPKRIEFLFRKIITVDGFFGLESKNYRTINKKVKRLNIDLAIDFFDFDKGVIYRLHTLFAMKPKHSITFNHPELTIFDTNIVNNSSAHITQRMVSVLKLLEINECDYCARLNLSKYDYPSPYELASKIKKEHKKLVIFNPYGSQKNRTLSMEQIDKTLKYLSSVNSFYTVVFNMGKDIKYDHLKNIMMSPYQDAENAFALVCSADAVITVDTAIVHLASAFNIKQYCIYNNRLHIGIYNNNIMWGPNNKKATQLCTSENIRTEAGDDLTKFDLSILFDAIDKDIKLNTI